MFVCGRPTLLPEPGVEDCPLVTLIVPSGVALYPGPEMVMLYVPGSSVELVDAIVSVRLNDVVALPAPCMLTVYQLMAFSSLLQVNASAVPETYPFRSTSQIALVSPLK